MRDCKPTVLVVEDEDGVRNLIVTILRLSGFEALHCADAVSAQDLLAVHGNYIQLMVTDVNLGPDLGGIELARGLRDQYPHLRVLYISGLVDDSPVEEEVRGGHAHFLPKPFTPKALTAMVSSIMDDRFRMVPGDPILE
jgi:DNA-binding NtrC family response regulator